MIWLVTGPPDEDGRSVPAIFLLEYLYEIKIQVAIFF